MNLSPDRLDDALSRGLAPLYVVAGEEPLLVTESADAIRAAAKADGYTDRRVLHAESGFDWSELRAAGQALSLFAEKTLIEVHRPTGSPGRDGGAAIKAAAEGDMEGVLAGGHEGLLEIIALTHSGMTTDAFKDAVAAWFA